MEFIILTCLINNFLYDLKRGKETLKKMNR